MFDSEEQTVVQHLASIIIVDCIASFTLRDQQWFMDKYIDKFAALFKSNSTGTWSALNVGMPTILTGVFSFLWIM